MNPREGSKVGALLRELARGEPLRTGQLAERAGVTSSAVSALLQPYCGRGQVLVCKVSMPGRGETNEYRLGASAPASVWLRLPPANIMTAPAPTTPAVAPPVPTAKPAPAVTAQAPAPATAPAPAASTKPAAVVPRFALWSDGTLVIQTPEVSVTLPEPHTRLLLRYLDRLRSAEDAACA